MPANTSIKSMTGFGRSALEEPGRAQVWEIRSVNSRYLDLKWRMPPFLRSQEPDWEKTVREFAARGRVEINLQLKVDDPDIAAPVLNTALAQGLLSRLERFAADTGRGFTPDLNRLINISYVWEDQDRQIDPELLAFLKKGLTEALADWNRSRESEGAFLTDDLNKRNERLQKRLEQIRERAPNIKEEKFKALNTRITNLLKEFSVDADEERILQEISVLADKLDISEELTRLEAHLTRLREIIAKGGEVGKRLDFTLQECFREINTCGNKAQDMAVSKLTVDFKTELEKCREQVQNLE